MKHRFAVGVMLLFALAAAGCSGGGNGGNSGNGVGDASLTIVYTGNIGSLVNVCGCRVPLGGFGRRAHLQEQFDRNIDNMLVVDSGAMLYPRNIIIPPYDHIYRVRSHFITDAMDIIGLDAANISSYDLANSADSLLAMTEDADAAWLSANLVWRDSGEPVFPADRTFEVGGLTVGVFGIIDTKTAGMDMFLPHSPVAAADPVEAARREVKKLSETCDLIVMLAYMDYQPVQNLVNDVPGIHVAVVSHTRDHEPNSDHKSFAPLKAGDTILVRCPDGGRVVGRLDLEIVDGNLDFEEDIRAVHLLPEELQNRQAEKSVYRNRFYDLHPDMGNDTIVKPKLDAYNEWEENYRYENGLPLPM